MGYINFRVGKMKGATLSRAQKHNQRTGFCENTDESRRELNRIMTLFINVKYLNRLYTQMVNSLEEMLYRH